jgi:hypothetical protein
MLDDRMPHCANASAQPTAGGLHRSGSGRLYRLAEA